MSPDATSIPSRACCSGIRLIVLKLLTNAVKFTEAGGEVYLIVEQDPSVALGESDAPGAVHIEGGQIGSALLRALGNV